MSARAQPVLPLDTSQSKGEPRVVDAPPARDERDLLIARLREFIGVKGRVRFDEYERIRAAAAGLRDCTLGEKVEALTLRFGKTRSTIYRILSHPYGTHGR